MLTCDVLLDLFACDSNGGGDDEVIVNDNWFFDFFTIPASTPSETSRWIQSRDGVVIDESDHEPSEVSAGDLLLSTATHELVFVV
jgi:hypothetical protein